MYSKVILMGRISQNIELKTTQNGKSVVTLSVAVDSSYHKQGEKPQTHFINVVCWGNTAEFVSRNFCKGLLIFVEGELSTKTYDDKNGVTHYVTEVVANKVSFTGERREKPNANANANVPQNQRGQQQQQVPQQNQRGQQQVPQQAQQMPQQMQQAAAQQVHQQYNAAPPQQMQQAVPQQQYNAAPQQAQQQVPQQQQVQGGLPYSQQPQQQMPPQQMPQQAQWNGGEVILDDDLPF